MNLFFLGREKSTSQPAESRFTNYYKREVYDGDHYVVRRGDRFEWWRYLVRERGGVWWRKYADRPARTFWSDFCIRGGRRGGCLYRSWFVCGRAGFRLGMITRTCLSSGKRCSWRTFEHSTPFFCRYPHARGTSALKNHNPPSCMNSHNVIEHNL